MINSYVSKDYFHGLEKAIDKAVLMGFRGHETAEIRPAYAFFLGYISRNNVHPRTEKEAVAFREYKNEEAYRLIELRIQRTVDEWQTQEPDKRRNHFAAEREYDDG